MTPFSGISPTARLSTAAIRPARREVMPRLRAGDAGTRSNAFCMTEMKARPVTPLVAGQGEAQRLSDPPQHQETAPRQVVACHARSQVACTHDFPQSETVHQDLQQAIDCLSSDNRVQGRELMRRLCNPEAVGVLYEDDICRAYRRYGQPLPDPVNDSPGVFVRKCLAIDKVLYASGPCISCTFFVLEQAVATCNLPVAFKMLQGLRQTHLRGELAPSTLMDDEGYSLLHRPFFYRSTSAQWRRLVLAARVLDVNQAGTGGLYPLNWAIFLAPDADAVAALLQAGADPNHRDNPGPTALSFCTQALVPQRMQKMQLLLDHDNIDPNCVTCTDPACAVSALHWAVSARSDEAVIQLLNHPATDPDMFCPGSGTPLAMAAARFLDEPGYPEAIVLALARAGGRLRLSGPHGERVDCEADIRRFQKLRGVELGGARGQEARLQALVEKGQHACRAAGGRSVSREEGQL